jgi:endonuclease YncB( thermonuclease family)
VSTDLLHDLINNQIVTCIGNTTDRYKRLIAVCYANGIDLNAALVDAGLALAYRKYSAQYIPNEENARQVKIGMWAGSFVSPWDWRRGKRLSSGQSEDQGKICCKICQKGKACGNSCINKSYTCSKPPGCACNKN